MFSCIIFELFFFFQTHFSLYWFISIYFTCSFVVRSRNVECAAWIQVIIGMQNISLQAVAKLQLIGHRVISDIII